MSISVSRVGVCVSDLDRATRFWCDGLGFQPGARFEVGSEFAATLEVDAPIAVVSQFVSRDGLTIELLHYATGSTAGRPSSARNLLGFTHLSLLVDDVDAVAATLVEHGGTRLDPTRARMEGAGGAVSDFVFVADPDGVRIELMRLPG
ncbi:MAG: VOC family protein [Actinobacteria bacterium]|nr:VOC family protein [Actinomycetota bacterium]